MSSGSEQLLLVTTCFMCGHGHVPHRHNTLSRKQQCAAPPAMQKVAAAVASRAAAHAWARSVEVSTNVRFRSHLSHISAVQPGGIEIYWHAHGGSRAASAQRIQAPEQPDQHGSQHPDGGADNQGRLRAGLGWARRPGVRKDAVPLRA